MRGLKQAFNDALDMARAARPDEVAAINAELKRLGAPPLAVLLAHRDGRVRRLLRGEVLRDDTECYLLKEYTIGLDSELSDAEREIAEQLLRQYEGSRSTDPA